MRQGVEVGNSPPPRLGSRDDVDIAVGATIRILRQGRGMSQATLATAVGVRFQQVQKYESGANRVSASMLSKIAETLEVPIAELFGAGAGAGDGTGAGVSGLTDEIAKLLSEAGALQLLRSYARLPRHCQSALARFVSTIATATT
jgi:transcriptional regulator with XRE-family HTH domain